MSVADFIEDYFELNPGEKLKLHDYQREFLECPSKFRLVLKARQVGISSVVAWEALAYALLEPRLTILFVSASHRQAIELLNYVKRILSNLRLKKPIPTLEETKQSIIFENGSRIISLPNNPNTIQGIRAHRVYIDEFAIMDNDRKILEAILPSISLGGYVTIISRPFGQRGEFYRLVKEAREGKNEFTLFEIPWTRCKYKPYRDNVEKLKKIFEPASFRETFCCEFIDETRSYFPYELMLPCVDETLTQPRPGMDLRFGIDFGRKQNSTVITIVESKGDYFYVRHIKEFLGISYTTQLSYISRKINDLQPSIVNVDEFGVGVRLFEELREKHGSIIVPVGLSNQVKNELITNLRILFEDKKIRIPRNEKLMAQLHALQRKVSGGYIKWEPGKSEEWGKHDDYVWSLAMAVGKKYVPQISYFKIGESHELKGYIPEFKTSLFKEEEE